MYICICRAITDHQIREAAHAGAGSADAVCSLLGAGDGCGTCVDSIAALVEQSRGRRPKGHGPDGALPARAQHPAP